jgi:glutamyl-tRNA synthetase
MKNDEQLAEAALPYAVSGGLFGKEGALPDAGERRKFTAAMPLIRERLVFLGEVPGKLRYLFAEPAIPEAREFIPKKLDLSRALELLRRGRELIGPLAGAKDDGEAEAIVKSWSEKTGVKPGDLMMPLRAALTGERVSPPLFGSLRILGAEEAELRVDRALEALGRTVF